MVSSSIRRKNQNDYRNKEAEKMKRALYLFLSVLMCLGCSVPVLAASDDAITRVVVSDEAKSVEKDGVIFTREDVPSSIAACDASFRNKPQDANISTLEVQNTKSTYWDVKGWSEPAGIAGRGTGRNTFWFLCTCKRWRSSFDLALYQNIFERSLQIRRFWSAVGRR